MQCVCVCAHSISLTVFFVCYGQGGKKKKKKYAGSAKPLLWSRSFMVLNAKVVLLHLHREMAVNYLQGKKGLWYSLPKLFLVILKGRAYGTHCNIIP